MSNVESFIGVVAASMVRRLIDRGHPGIRLQNVTGFSPASLLEGLHDIKPVPRVAVAGENAAGLAKASKYPKGALTTDLAVATEWRNDPNVKESVIVVSFGEEERLGSFHRFTEVRDRDLYQEICNIALSTVCPNEVLKRWWQVLEQTDARRQISVFRLASYFLYVKGRPGQIPDASREGLFHLGLLPSKEFFENSTPAGLKRSFNANRLLINRIEILSNADRDRLNRSIEAVKPAQRQKCQEILGSIFKYNRSGTDHDRQVLLAEEVRSLFESKKPSRGTGKTPRMVPIERAGVDAILQGDDQELEELGRKLNETINAFEENETPVVTFDLTSRSEQASAKIPPPLVRLLNRCVTPDKFGGVFKFPNSANFDVALGDIDNAGYTPFGLYGDKSFHTLLTRVIDLGIVESEVMDRWNAFVDARKLLSEYAVAIAVSPMVALSSDKTLLKAGQAYINTYAELSAAIRDRYEAVASRSSTGARHLCAQLLVLDTIYFETPGTVHAILSPLHPLHLWKYVRLAEQLRDEKGTLNDEQKQVLAESTVKLPHFVTALFVPEGLVSNSQPLVLPESHQIVTLPCYQQENPHYAGTEGQERLIRILRKFLVLYPHAKRSFRLCLVDPPELPGFLEQLAAQIANESLPVDGMNLVVFRTLDRPISIGSDDQQLETIASVFAAEDSPRFVLNIRQSKTTYSDINTHLEQDPVHVLAIFDPSRSTVGRFTSRETGFVHPLVLPKEFQYDPIEDQLIITPAATGDLFDVYYSLQNRLNNALTGSHFGISSSLGPDFPKTGSLLTHCTWLVLGDKLVDALPNNGGQMISYEPGIRRDIIVLTENLTKFERAFDYYLRKANLDPTEESLRELIASSAELVGEGLLGLIRPDGDE
ncbi:hypothetical protein LBMAG46_20400 [Planctomycetia bacterium]|nr:hypothetical protein LBMAG46_20400 [Planctomycetia bacterium]